MTTNPRYSQYGGASSPNRGTGVYTGKITLIYDDGRVRVFINTFGRNIGPCRIINKSAGDAIALNDEVLCTYANDTSDELIVVGRLTERVDPVSESTSGLVVEASTTSELVRITQKGAGAALLVEDSTNPDSTPFIIDTSGNVGIGVSSPTAKIDVSGSAVISGNLTVDTTTLKVDSSTNRVGIGTASPLSPLHIADAGGYGVQINSTTNLGLIGSNGESDGLRISGGIPDQVTVGGNMYLYGNTHATRAADVALMSNGNEVLTVNGVNVGIGTISPTEKLDVAGNIALTGSVVFEGATADGFETTLNVTDPTADRTITLPNVTGTVITTGNLSSITSTGTLTDLTVTNAINGTLTKTVTGTGTADLIYGQMADSDQFRIRIGGTATNAGYVEIATADDGTEPIYVRQYTGVFTTLTRTATLLDDSGNTTFPGTVTATTFSGNASTATNLSTDRTNWSTNGTISATVGQLGWKNYGNSHTIFDASNSTSPQGGAVNNTNAAVAWTGTYPTLMGWNGTSTYGVRVDSARTSDNTTGTAATVTTAAQSSITSLGTLTALTLSGTITLPNSTNNKIFTSTTADSAIPWANGPVLQGATGWSFYSTINASYRMGFRNSTTGTSRYMWCADNTFLGAQPNDGQNNTTLNVIGGTAWFSAMGTGSGQTVVNNYGFLQYVSSRRELKENIVSILPSDSLNRILALRPVEFTMKPEHVLNASELTPFDIKRGFIAQEVAEVDHWYGQWGWVDESQMMVTTEALNGELPLEEATPIYWNHDAVIADLVASIQVLTARISELEASQ